MDIHAQNVINSIHFWDKIFNKMVKINFVIVARGTGVIFHRLNILTIILRNLVLMIEIFLYKRKIGFDHLCHQLIL